MPIRHIVRSRQLESHVTMGGGLTVIALGTSLMATPLWTGELRAQIERCTQRQVQLEVVAKSGMTSRWGLEQTSSLIEARPDILLIEFAANDANLRRFITRSESRRNHETIIRAVRQAQPKIKIFLIAINPTWGLRGFWIRPWLDRYYDLYVSLAEIEHVEFIDIRPRWGLGTIHETIPDGLHPTPQAMERIAAPYIAEIVCKTAPKKDTSGRDQ